MQKHALFLVSQSDDWDSHSDVTFTALLNLEDMPVTGARHLSVPPSLTLKSHFQEIESEAKSENEDILPELASDQEPGPTTRRD